MLDGLLGFNFIKLHLDSVICDLLQLLIVTFLIPPIHPPLGFSWVEPRYFTWHFSRNHLNLCLAHVYKVL